MRVGDFKLIIGAVLYFTVACAVFNWHCEKYPISNTAKWPTHLEGAAAFWPAVLWPAYLIYKGVDTIVCPAPVEFEETH